MPDYAWPDAEHRTLIGKRISRVDSPAKVSGQAKYTYDVHRPGMLYGKVLRSPYAHAKVVSIDTSAAEKMPGVKAVQIVQGPGSTIHWAGDEIVAVAAVDEPTAEDAVRAIKVEYQQLPYLVSDAEPPKGSAEGQGPLSMDDIDDMLDNQVPSQQMVSQIQQYGITAKPSEDTLKGLKDDGATDAVLDAIRAAAVHPEAGSRPKSNYQKAAAQTQGDADKAFAEAEVVSEGLYGIPVITHCCLESHGSISEWTDADHLFMHISTQNRFRNRRADGGAAEDSGQQHPRSPGPRRRRFRQQVFAGSLGNLYCADLQESRRQTRTHHAGARCGTEGRGGAAVGVCPRESGREERRHPRRLAVAVLGHRRPGWRRHAAHSLCLRRAQPAQRTHRHPQQHRSRTRLACAQPSPGRGAYHVRAG